MRKVTTRSRSFLTVLNVFPELSIIGKSIATQHISTSYELKSARHSSRDEVPLILITQKMDVDTPGEVTEGTAATAATEGTEAPQKDALRRGSRKRTPPKRFVASPSARSPPRKIRAKQTSSGRGASGRRAKSKKKNGGESASAALGAQSASAPSAPAQSGAPAAAAAPAASAPLSALAIARRCGSDKDSKLLPLLDLVVVGDPTSAHVLLAKYTLVAHHCVTTHSSRHTRSNYKEMVRTRKLHSSGGIT